MTRRISRSSTLSFEEESVTLYDECPSTRPVEEILLKSILRKGICSHFLISLNVGSSFSLRNTHYPTIKTLNIKVRLLKGSFIIFDCWTCSLSSKSSNLFFFLLPGLDILIIFRPASYETRQDSSISKPSALLTSERIFISGS